MIPILLDFCAIYMTSFKYVDFMLYLWIML